MSTQRTYIIYRLQTDQRWRKTKTIADMKLSSFK